MEIKGKIIAALPLQSGVSKAGKEWKKREYVIETQEANSQYTHQVCFNFFGDRVDQFPLAVGDEVVVSVDLDSREFNGRWYTDVRAYKYEKVNAGAAAPSAPAPVAPPTSIPGDYPPAPADLPAAGPTEDLPF